MDLPVMLHFAVGGSSSPIGRGSAGSEDSSRATRETAVERFALRIAKPGSAALFIDPDNKPAGFASIQEAARSGRPFCVEPRRDILVLDGDLPDDADKVELWALSLRKFGLRPVIMASGRPGHQHIFVVVGDRALRQRCESEAKELKLDVRTGQRIRSPFAPHRLGLQLRLVYPASLEEAYEDLGPKKLAQLRRINRDCLLFLCKGIRHGTVGNDVDRSRAIFSLAVSWINADRGRDSLWRALNNPKNLGGEKVREMGPREAQRWFDRTWNKALNFVRQNPARPVGLERARKIADRLAAAIEAARPSGLWKGRAGANREVVLRCHLSNARRFGPLYSLSVREIAGELNLARSTVSGANSWLSCNGWIHVLKSGIGDVGTLWELQDLDSDILSQPPTGGRGAECPVKDRDRSEAERDVFGCVGRTAYQTWLALEDGDSAATLAPRLGIKVSQVRRRLLRLKELGLAIRSTDRTWKRRRRQEVNFTRLAEILQASGITEKRRALHRYEREQYRNKNEGPLRIVLE